MRYSRNIARGYGFVWNPGEAPVWGSTSFLWTVLLGALGATGLSIESAAIFANAVIGGVLILTMAWTMHVQLGASRGASLVLLSVFSLSTFVAHIMTGFSVLLFSFLVLLSYVGTRVSFNPETDSRTARVLLVGVSILLVMTRPEGILIVIMSFVVGLYRKRDDVVRYIRHIALPVAAGIGFFFLGCFAYFGTIVPNPFYVKVNGALYFTSMRNSIAFLQFFQVVLPVLLASIWLLSLDEHEVLWEVTNVVPVMCYYLAYMFVMQAQNVIFRFQFPILPILYVMAAPGIDRTLMVKFPTRFVSTRTLVLGAVILLLMAAQYGETRRHVPNVEDESKKIVGRALSKYADRGYTFMLSEAGMLPYFSDWRVIDILGLNDPYIARHGLTEIYIAEQNPELAMILSPYSEYSVEMRNATDQSRLLLLEYCMSHNYTLACVIRYSIETAPRYEWYFIRADFPDAHSILTDLCSLPVTYAYRAVSP
ncbi:MAG: hypothetical protein DRO93_09485 [Candidatus Thorarchaeota archaeon]|nr:MAG: hypothetical protein DRO93_09485 [Candidatus Thorarchaeota archaeon]